MITTLLETGFWAAAALLAYGYVGFSALMYLLARLRPSPTASDPSYRPSVSLVIAACNEEKTIREKLENTLRLDYPRDRLEVIVAADGSNDATADIVREYAGRGIRLLHRPERQGKSAALARAVAECGGDILLFSDANTDYSVDVIRNMVKHFADPEVGGVSGRKIVLEDGDRAATQGETAYWSYESSLKTWESAVGSIATADGEIFAMRRILFRALPASIVHDDMFLTLQMVQDGYRVVYEPAATSAEFASRTLFDEFHLKVRYASAGYQILARFRRLFLPVPTAFGWLFLSHKLLRWSAPFLLLAVFATSAALSGPFYDVMFWGQVAFYAAALAGLVTHRWTNVRLFYFPLYFSAMNTAALYGFVRYFLVGQSPLWRKAAR